ncbi:MAG: hypothetical protein IH596_12890 [Bacteroidales bacterium]|nr:hypothetical protein [Bacteroidales bacterium]
MNHWLAILILSFGTAILVSHAAIPHHHHDGAACYHHDEETSHAQEASPSSCPAHPLDFNCSLKQFYLAPANQREITPGVLLVSNNTSSQTGLPAVMQVRLAPESVPLKLLLHNLPGDYIAPGILSSASRAPPLS